MRPRAVCLGNLFRDQLDRYGELELVAERWLAAVERLPDDAALAVNGDDPQLGRLAASPPGALVFGVDDPRLARPSLQHAADSKYCVRAGRRTSTPPRTSGTSATTAAPPAATRARRSTSSRATSSSPVSSTPRSRSSRRRGLVACACACPGLYNVYNALAAASLARTLGAALDDVAAGLERFGAAFGRFERIAIGDRRLLMLLIKNPAGANEAIRTLVEGRPPRVAVIALNDAIADGKDVSWIWDVDFEPLLDGLERVVATGDRAAELALRCKYAGFAAERIDVLPDLAPALERGLALSDRGRASSSSSPRTPRCSRCGSSIGERGAVRPYWEQAA